MKWPYDSVPILQLEGRNGTRAKFERLHTGTSRLNLDLNSPESQSLAFTARVCFPPDRPRVASPTTQASARLATPDGVTVEKETPYKP